MLNSIWQQLLSVMPASYITGVPALEVEVVDLVTIGAES
jgi:hypothetical protein